MHTLASAWVAWHHAACWCAAQRAARPRTTELHGCSAGTVCSVRTWSTRTMGKHCVVLTLGKLAPQRHVNEVLVRNVRCSSDQSSHCAEPHISRSSNKRIPIGIEVLTLASPPKYQGLRKRRLLPNRPECCTTMDSCTKASPAHRFGCGLQSQMNAYTIYHNDMTLPCQVFRSDKLRR